MKNVPHLTSEQVNTYNKDGFLAPFYVLSEEEATEILVASEERLKRKDTLKFELTDPFRVKVEKDDSNKEIFIFGDGEDSDPHIHGFLFNQWKEDERFRKVATNPQIGRLASQLLGGKSIRLWEDNVIIKSPGAKPISWHQDHGYWAVDWNASDNFVTIIVALSSLTRENGGLLQVVPGSHNDKQTETLPVNFGSDKSIMGDYRPKALDISQNPEKDGYTVLEYPPLMPGLAGAHHPLLWHASGPNKTKKSRYILALRYVAEGTVWRGNERFPSDEVGLKPGDIIKGDHFPLIYQAS